jgi:hypothetical protein
MLRSSIESRGTALTEYQYGVIRFAPSSRQAVARTRRNAAGAPGKV